MHNYTCPKCNKVTIGSVALSIDFKCIDCGVDLKVLEESEKEIDDPWYPVTEKNKFQCSYCGKEIDGVLDPIEKNRGYEFVCNSCKGKNALVEKELVCHDCGGETSDHTLVFGKETGIIKFLCWKCWFEKLRDHYDLKGEEKIFGIISRNKIFLPFIHGKAIKLAELSFNLPKSLLMPHEIDGKEALRIVYADGSGEVAVPEGSLEDETVKFIPFDFQPIPGPKI